MSAAFFDLQGKKKCMNVKKSDTLFSNHSYHPLDINNSKPPMKSESPHTEQVLDYLKSEYSSYLARAKEDKEGENYKVYRSLESPNQWTSNTTSSRQSSSKYNPKEVIRNRPGNNNTLDLLFEINRSVYQQRERQNRG